LLGHFHAQLPFYDLLSGCHPLVPRLSVT
jgi:hypothetical protein